MSKKFDHTTELWTTSNRFLAKAIAFAGIPCNVYREYDNAYLTANGCSTIKDAEGKNKLGYECWIFEKSPELKKVIEAYNSENKAINELVAKNEDLPFCEDAKMETKCREFVRAIRGDRLLDKLLRNSVPRVRTWDNETGEPELSKNSEGHTVATYPASKIVSVNANNEIREHLKV